MSTDLKFKQYYNRDCNIVPSRKTLGYGNVSVRAQTMQGRKAFQLLEKIFGKEFVHRGLSDMVTSGKEDDVVKVLNNCRKYRKIVAKTVKWAQKSTKLSLVRK